jgi:hypothetical protein
VNAATAGYTHVGGKLDDITCIVAAVNCSEWNTLEDKKGRDTDRQRGRERGKGESFPESLQ